MRRSPTPPRGARAAAIFGLPRLPSPGSVPCDARTRRGLWQGKRLDTWKVGWASDGRKSDHGVVPPQHAGASTCDIQGPGNGWGRHRNGNDKARSHGSKIVVSIGVELRARPGRPIPNCPPKPRCTSVSGPIRAVQVPARERISRCLSNLFPTPRPVVDAPDTQATGASPRASPCKRMGLDGKARNNRYKCGSRDGQALSPVNRRAISTLSVQCPLPVDRPGRRCFQAVTSIDPHTGPGPDSPMQGVVERGFMARRDHAPERILPARTDRFLPAWPGSGAAVHSNRRLRPGAMG